MEEERIGVLWLFTWLAVSWGAVDRCPYVSMICCLLVKKGWLNAILQSPQEKIKANSLDLQSKLTSKNWETQGHNLLHALIIQAYPTRPRPASQAILWATNWPSRCTSLHILHEENVPIPSALTQVARFAIMAMFKIGQEEARSSLFWRGKEGTKWGNVPSFLWPRCSLET